MPLVTKQARELRDEERARLETELKASLAGRYDGRTERRIEVRGGTAFEVLVSGSYDASDDPTSELFVWIFVRPKAVSAIPVMRWLLSARATLVVDE